MKFVHEDHPLLVSQKLKLHSTDNTDGKRELLYDLQLQLDQRVNRKTFGLFYPGLWFYYHLQDADDTTKFANWKRKAFAEQPTFADSIKSEQIKFSLESVLFNNGYYDGSAEYEIEKISPKKSKVVYHVFPEHAYKLNKMIYITKDSVIQPYLSDLKLNSLFVIGERIPSSLYDQEAYRITHTLRNKGFASFSRSFVNSLLIDTIHGNLDVTLEIAPPKELEHHERFNINKVNVYLDVNLATAKDSISRDTIIDGIHFYSPTSEFIVDPEAIKKMVYFKPGDLYNQDNIDFTNKKLGSLSYFKFIKIKTDLAETEKAKINVSIYLTPGKKQGFGLDYEIIYESNTSLNQALIGGAINVSYKSKNIFNGGEIMNTELETGLAVNPSQTDRFINTIDIKLSNEIKFPLFSNYLHLWNALNKISFGKKKLINPVFYDNMKKLATTNVNASYNFTKIIDLYSINALNLSYGITYQKSNYEKYQFNHLGISLLNTKLDPLFVILIKDNIFLVKSLTERQLFSGILFRDFTYTYYSPPNKWSEDWYGRINFELSGAEVWFANKSINLFRKSDVNFSESLQFSQFARAEFEGRYLKKFTKSVSTAYRALVGIIQPYGYTTQAPFVKQFFVGGPNSLRAWRVRELGPGTFRQNDTVNVFYQTGNFKIELNAELRFNLFWRLKGAVFLDIGNVWDLETSSFGKEGVLTSNFYKQFGAGTGVGIRADFSFFVIRFDAGLKLAYPEKWVFDPANIQFRDFNPNIAINYPF